ncbi:hypothetical protein IAT38_007773 [Cryptococcus sp. DSM 104549]
MADTPDRSASPSPLPSPLPIPPSAYPRGRGRDDLDDDHDDHAPPLHSSPAFDYHQERRLHLQDETWMSHHLPRLPPSSISEAGSSSSRTEYGTSLKGRMMPGDLDTSPRALSRQRPLSPMAQTSSLASSYGNLERGGDGMAMTHSLSSDAEGDNGEDLSASFQRQAKINALSSMVSPSGPEDGDLDPAASIIHREERDKQERLDLEEEAAERELAMKSLGGGKAENKEQPGVSTMPDGPRECLPDLLCLRYMRPPPTFDIFRRVPPPPASVSALYLSQSQPFHPFTSPTLRPSRT